MLKLVGTLFLPASSQMEKFGTPNTTSQERFTFGSEETLTDQNGADPTAYGAAGKEEEHGQAQMML